MNFYTFLKDSLGASVRTEDTLIEEPWSFYTESCKNKERLKTQMIVYLIQLANKVFKEVNK